MEAAAEPGTVYLADTTWRAVRQYVECRRVGELAQVEAALSDTGCRAGVARLRASIR